MSYIWYDKQSFWCLAHRQTRSENWDCAVMEALVISMCDLIQLWPRTSIVVFGLSVV